MMRNDSFSYLESSFCFGLLLLLCFGMPFSLQAEKLLNNQLDEVEVSASRVAHNDDFSSSTSLKPSSYLSEKLDNGSLSELLAKSTSVFMKESGNGMLSTISLRGTSASHTTVNWEGVSINSHTMGQVDLSQLPAFFFDEVAIYPGGEATVHGNGSIGGSVELSTLQTYRDTFRLSAHTSGGSYGTLFGGGKLLLGTPKIQSSTALFYRQSDNDFKFNYRDETFQQQNASFYDYGLLENLCFRLSEKQTLRAHLWHTFYDRNIQPMMQNNADTSKYEEISNRSSKALIDYSLFMPFLLKIQLGWMADDQWYEGEKIATDDWFGQTSVEKVWYTPWSFSSIHLKVGGDFHVIRPEVYAYLDTLVENRSSLYLLSKFKLKKRWALTCNIRKDFVTNSSTPLAFSSGANCELMNKNHQRLMFSTNISRNVHVPTLNDKYWGRRDSHDLQSENGWNLEWNGSYQYGLEHYSLFFQTSMYRNAVNNWILWLPRGTIWKPSNVDHVVAKGLEVTLNNQWSLLHSFYSLSMNYAFNHTEVVAGFAEMKPFEGRQMPLIPQHTISATFCGKIHSFSFSLMPKWSGERSTSDVFDVMDAYFLLNALVDYAWRISVRKSVSKKHQLNVGLQVNNILGTEYQIVPYRAMPLQNILINLRYCFISIKSNEK